MTLVRDGFRLAGHRGGPELHEHRAAAEPAVASVVAALRQELAELREEITVLRAKVQHQQAEQEVQVPVPMNLEEVVVPEVRQQECVQQQPVEQTVRKRSHIRLNFVDQQKEWKVTVPQAESLCKIKGEYCRIRGLQASQVRFKVNGELVAAGSTVEDLGLKDKDIIEVAIVRESKYVDPKTIVGEPMYVDPKANSAKAADGSQRSRPTRGFQVVGSADHPSWPHGSVYRWPPDAT